MDWANAPKLTVTVAFPPEWGNSPQSGEGKCGDTRKGYEFGVEFVPLPSYGFERWLALPTDGFAEWLELNKNKSSYDIDDFLNADSVTITESTNDIGTRIAKVKINTLEPVTLVPWCSERLRVTQSNPPLISTGMSYSRGQQIKIWFNIDIDCENNVVPFGENTINIIGQNIDEEGSLYNEDGDVTSFFNEPVYDSLLRTITIQPYTGIKAPPENVIFTVTVGTGISAKNGEGLIAPVNFSYRTNTMLVNNVYYAENVWAIHKPSSTSDENDFFYRGAPTGRDRRLRKNGGRYEVTIYFKVTRSSNEIIKPDPENIKIAEIDYANLTGGDRSNVNREQDWTFTTIPSTGLSGADYVYRQNNPPPSPDTLGTYYYKVTYFWDEPPDEAGIIRLVVMPYRDGPEGATPDNWQNAAAEGRFVAVVLDDLPPGRSPNSTGDAVFTLSGESNKDANGVYNYNNSAHKNLTISANFSNIADNGIDGGIRQTAATRDKPWTMDNQSDVEWQYRITGNNSVESAWFPLTENNKSLDLTTTGLDSVNTRKIEVKYRDKLGNTSEWIDTEREIRYHSPTFNAVTKYKAEYNEKLNIINVTWTTPLGMTGVELQIDDRQPQEKPGPENTENTYKIENVPHIDASGVTSGVPVINVVGYTISLTAYNAYGKADPLVFKIWNIPSHPKDYTSIGMSVSDLGMSVSNDSPVEEIKSQADLAGMVTGTPNKKYVLTQDITLNGEWTPISNFQGIFYGNGHTIIVESGASFSSGQNSGIFINANTTGEKTTEIRDLCVEYRAGVSANRSRFGGIVGYIANTNTMKIINCIVAGTLKSSAGYVGGIIGLNSNGLLSIINSYSSLNIELNSSTGGYAGGIIGSNIVNSNSGIFTNIISVGDVTCEKTGTNDDPGNIYVGGIVGGYNAGTFTNIKSVGKVTGKGTGDIHAGGIVGEITGGTLLNSISVSDVTCEKTGTGNIYVGGIVGNTIGGTNLLYSGNIKVTRTSGSATGSLYVGGIAGYGTSTIKSCESKDINIDVSDDGSLTTYVGGIIGYIYNSGSNYNIENCVFDNYEGYTIECESLKAQTSYIGYIVGQAHGVNIIDCQVYFIDDPHVTVLGKIHFGGIGGYLGDNMTVKNCNIDCLFGGFGFSSNEMFYIGGIAGSINYHTDGNSSYGIVTLEKCRVGTNIYSTGNGDMYTGGLVGYVNGGINSGTTYRHTISECVSSSNVVNVTSNGSGNIYTGGLVGYASYGSIKNCYFAKKPEVTSINSVTVDKTVTGGNVYTGGIVGYTSNCTVQFTISNCYVTAKSYSSTGDVRSGGIVGYHASGTLANNAALGVYILPSSTAPYLGDVNARGGANRSAGRIYGYSAGSCSKNYAIKDMCVSISPTYTDTSKGPTIASSFTDTSEHGEGASSSDFRGTDFWIKTTGLAFNTNGTGTGTGINDLVYIWNFDIITGRGYPKLAWEQ